MRGVAPRAAEETAGREDKRQGADVPLSVRDADDIVSSVFAAALRGSGRGSRLMSSDTHRRGTESASGHKSATRICLRCGHLVQ
ncbi:hypothetical protein GCM10022232_87620 [Streptomyces plumbiresistens]|uniref:Uncharacterized protein n=1 Tax=Streptomyces plumbiresistens TaxID=511811 RepID=A0ABP7TNN8_9ACTN